MQRLKPGDKCWFVESTEKYPEQQLVEGVVVSYNPNTHGETGEYVVRVSRLNKVEWRTISECRVFGGDDKAQAEEEAKRLNLMATVKPGLVGKQSDDE